MSEWDFEWPMDDEDDYTHGVPCPECGEFELLSPVSGLCYDCENLDEEDVEEDESEADEEMCEDCGQAYPPENLEDGICIFCLDEEE